MEKLLSECYRSDTDTFNDDGLVEFSLHVQRTESFLVKFL